MRLCPPPSFYKEKIIMNKSIYQTKIIGILTLVLRLQIGVCVCVVKKNSAGFPDCCQALSSQKVLNPTKFPQTP